MTDYTYLNAFLPGHNLHSVYSQLPACMHGLKIQVAWAKALISPGVAMPLTLLCTVAI